VVDKVAEVNDKVAEVNDKVAEVNDKVAEVNDKVAEVPTKQDIDDAIKGKQDTLVSGTNIKTINGESVLGEGDIKTTNEFLLHAPNKGSSLELFSIEFNKANIALIQSSKAKGNQPIVFIIELAGNAESPVIYPTEITIGYNAIFISATRKEWFNDTGEKEDVTYVFNVDGTVEATYTSGIDTAQFATKQEVIDNEEVIANALNDLKSRIDALQNEVESLKQM